MKEISIVGRWRIPKKGNRYTAGTLVGNPKLGYRLLTEKSLDGNPINKYDFTQTEYAIVHGKTIDGEYTLIDCYQRGSQINPTSKITEVTHIIGDVIKGDLISGLEEPKYKECVFSLTNLSAWMATDPIDWDEEDSNILVDPHTESRQFNIGELVINFEKNYIVKEAFGSEKITILSDYSIKVVSKVKLSVNDFHKIALEIADFVSFATSSYSELKYLHFGQFKTRGEVIPMVSYFIGEVTAIDLNWFFPDRLVVNFNDLNQDVLDNWYLLKEKLPMLTLLFLANNNNPDQYLEHQFFNLASALDYYCENTKIIDNKRLTGSRFKQLIASPIKMIIENLPIAEELKIEFKAAVSNLNRKSFRTSIIEIYNLNPDLHAYYQPYPEELAKDIAKFRVDIAHGKNINDLESLDFQTNILRYFMTTVILIELKIDPLVIKATIKKIARHRKIKNEGGTLIF